MPIYAYKCSSCGMSKDILRKLSDPALTLCPACGKEALEKQVTSAGFQLKGSGWYVTDFREGNKAAAEPSTNGEKSSDKPTDKGSDSTTSQASTDAASSKSPNKSSTPSEAKAAPTPAATSTAVTSAPSSGVST